MPGPRLSRRRDFTFLLRAGHIRPLQLYGFFGKVTRMVVPVPT